MPSLPECAVRERLQILSQISRELPVAEVGKRFGSSGYVVESVPLALFAAQGLGSGGIEGVVRSAIEPGGDTDTVASIAGQIAGTWLRAEAMPKNWLSRIENVEEVQGIAWEFSRTVARITAQ